MPKDNILLEKAYIAIRKPLPSVPSDEIDIEDELSMTPTNDVEDTLSIADDDILTDEPIVDVDNELYDDEDCCEEDHILVSNLNSIRESVCKIADFCATGKCLEKWADQKLAIAMDNLAQVARSVSVDCTD